MKFSKKAHAMKRSPIRRFNKFGKEAEESGKKVYHLNIGQPDVATPAEYLEAIKNFDTDVISYCDSSGAPFLRDSICRYFKKYDVDIKRENVIITNGGSEALNITFSAILDPGEEIIIAEPFYTNYNTFITNADAVMVPVSTTAETGYNFANKKLIEEKITDKTRAIACISPGNPTGQVLTLDEMKLIAEIAIEHDLWIVSDEVYREFVYDGKSQNSFGTIKEIEDRLIIVDSVSKRFSACGARIGCIVSKNLDMMNVVLKFTEGRLASSMLDQVGANALYNLDESYYDYIKKVYEGRRDAVYDEVMKIPGAFCKKPSGSFYLMAKLPVDNVEDFLMFLLTEFEDNNETVMFAPAEGFYVTEGLGRDEIRIAYVLNEKDLRRAVELIRLGLEKYKNR